MIDWKLEIEQSLSLFTAVAELAHSPISMDEMTVEFCEAPHHQATRLSQGRVAIFGFWADGEWLKICKAGVATKDRYVYQQYTFGAGKTLAKSLIATHKVRPIAGFEPEVPGVWIDATTHRVNIILAARRGPAVLSLLEAFLQARLKPRYEG